MTRAWTIEDVGHRPLTINAVVNMHRMKWAGATASTRRDWKLLTRQAKVPALVACEIEVTPLHKDHRSPQDAGSCAAEAKGAVDGIVDAGVIVDDSGDFLHRLSFLPPDICGRDGLRITITEAREATL